MRTDKNVGTPAWRDSPFICALADDERHFGHIVRDGEWVAFDATHHDERGGGIRQLGSFSNLEEAKRAVEKSIVITAPGNSAQACAAGSIQ